MKKLAILSMTFLFIVSVVYGQAQNVSKEKTKDAKKEMKAEKVSLKKLEGTNVNVIAKENFIADFPEAKNVNWKRADFFDRVEFVNKEGKITTAFYDIAGKLVGCTMNVTFSDLPAKSQKDIKEKYKDYTIGQVLFYDDNENNDTDMFLYGAQFGDADNYFVELSKGTNKIVLQVDPEGAVFFFKNL
jgi:hypothetical protein